MFESADAKKHLNMVIFAYNLSITSLVYVVPFNERTRPFALLVAGPWQKRLYEYHYLR